MSVLLNKDGKILMAAPGRPLLLKPLATTTPPSTPVVPPSTPVVPPSTPDVPSVTSLAGITGLTGWWDAGLATGVIGSSGTVLSAFGGSASGVVDKSGNGANLAVWHAAPTGTANPVATPRLNGLLGGLGLNTVVPPVVPPTGQQLPLMDPDQGLASTAIDLGAATPWTVFLVWSRPNWRQSSNGLSTLLSIAGRPILAADNNGGNRLLLFPGSNPAVLATTLTRRHTHAVILRNTPGKGIDAWLDSVQVATAVTNPLVNGTAAPLLFLHDGFSRGGAECWFHEAATWNTALDTAGLNQLLAYQARWKLGPRRGIQVLVTGQSNAGNGLNDGAWHLLAQGVAWHLGALGFGVVGAYGSPPAATCIHGEGIYPVAALGFSGSFLNNPNDGSDPSTWTLGNDGLAVQNWLHSYTDPSDAADIAVILWPWSEDDSTRQYSEKSTYEAAARRLLALERGMLSRSAASLPQVWWSALPFAYNANDPGTQMQREVVANMAADPSQNVTVVLPQTADSLPRMPASYDPATGTWVGGDSLHRDSVDNQRFGRLAAPLVARAILASGGGDTIATIPSGVPAAGGPVVTHVYRQSANTLVVTVRHDGGSDLIVPQTHAATGAGWAVMDGGSVANPGRIVNAIACTRLSPTQLQITLGANLLSPSTACRLFYPYGTTTIGRGNVVTDNLASATPPAGWNIAADLGSDWSVNMPVHVAMAPASGFVLSDTP
jgi:hypothetical protein